MNTKSSSVIGKIFGVADRVIFLTVLYVLVTWIFDWIFDGDSKFNPMNIVQGLVFSIIYLPIVHWIYKRGEVKS